MSYIDAKKYVIKINGMKELQNTNLKGHQVQSGPSVELKTLRR